MTEAARAGRCLSRSPPAGQRPGAVGWDSSRHVPGGPRSEARRHAVPVRRLRGRHPHLPSSPGSRRGPGGTDPAASPHRRPARGPPRQARRVCGLPGHPQARRPGSRVRRRQGQGAVGRLPSPAGSRRPGRTIRRRSPRNGARPLPPHPLHRLLNHPAQPEAGPE